MAFAIGIAIALIFLQHQLWQKIYKKWNNK